MGKRTKKFENYFRIIRQSFPVFFWKLAIAGSVKRFFSGIVICDISKDLSGNKDQLCEIVSLQIEKIRFVSPRLFSLTKEYVSTIARADIPSNMIYYSGFKLLLIASNAIPLNSRDSKNSIDLTFEITSAAAVGYLRKMGYDPASYRAKKFLLKIQLMAEKMARRMPPRADGARQQFLT